MMDPLIEELSHFDVFDEEHADRRYELLRYAQQKCPVAHTDADAGYYNVTRFEDLRAVCEDPATFSSTQPGVRYVPVRLPPLDEDPPLHKDYRQFLNKFFAPAYLKRYEDDMRALAHQIIDRWIDRGECEFVSEFAIPFTAGSLARVVLDAEGEERVGRAVHAVTRVALEGTPDTYEGVAMLAAEFMAEREAIGNARDDVLTALVKHSIDGRPLTMEERLGVVTVLLLGGLDTTRGAIANIGYHLASDPAIETRLRDPAWVQSDLDEFLRFESTVSVMARLVTKDTVLNGCPLQAGDKVAIHFNMANRDPDKFDRPDELVFGRDSNPHMAFGVGIHRCLGLHFARAQISMAFNELLTRITNVKIDPSAELKRTAGVSFPAPEQMHLTFDKC
jgi:cytochrome P450